MLKHIAVVLISFVFTVGLYLFKFGMPIVAADYANLGSFSSGSLGIIVAIYVIYLAIVSNREAKRIADENLVEGHLSLMKSYRTAHSGGYSNDGYAYLDWLWKNTYPSLDLPLNAKEVLENDNIVELMQWLRSVRKCKEKSVDLVNVMSPTEVKFAKLFLILAQIPDVFNTPISKRLSKTELSDVEKSLLQVD